MGKDNDKNIQYLKDHLEAVRNDYQKMKVQREKAYKDHVKLDPKDFHVIKRDTEHFEKRAEHLNKLAADIEKDIQKALLEEQKTKKKIRENEREKDNEIER